MVTFSLVIVRHGATDANEQGIIQGQSDHRLNEAGRRQALLLGRHFHQCQPLSSFTHAFSSDLSRARETAEIILSSLSNDGGDFETKYGGSRDDYQWQPKLVCDTRLRERKYGILEGKPTSVHKQAAMKSSVSPAEYTPEGGETLRDLYDRMSDFFRDLCARLASASPDGTLPPVPPRRSVVSPPLCKMGEYLPQQLQNGVASNRNNRVNSKVSRTSMLVPLPEQPVPSSNTAPLSTDAAMKAQAPPTFYLPTRIVNEQEPDLTTGLLVSSNNALQQNREAVMAPSEDHRMACGIQHPDHVDLSSFASSRDSGISAVSDKSLYVDTQTIEEHVVPGDRPSKRSYSACSSPGFSTCTGSPCDSSDIPANDTLETITTPPASIQSTNSWAYLYAGGCRTVGTRKVSVQSIASDDANFPDLDAQILVVTHGGAIRELFRYFVDELGCLMIGGKGAALRPCPNTGVSSFMINVDVDNEAPGIQENEAIADAAPRPRNISVICLGLHSKEHLSPWPVSPDADGDETDWFSKRPHTPPCDVSDFFVNVDEDEGGVASAAVPASSTLPKEAR